MGCHGWARALLRSFKLLGRNKICRLCGRHDLNILFARRRLVNSPAALDKPQICPPTRPHWTGICGRATPDSCARLAPYCSLSLVKYDISCGGQFLESVGWRACWVASAARPGGGFRRKACTRTRRRIEHVVD